MTLISIRMYLWYSTYSGPAEQVRHLPDQYFWSSSLLLRPRKVDKAMQSRLPVSRQVHDENGCGQEVIIHYLLIFCVKSSLKKKEKFESR